MTRRVAIFNHKGGVGKTTLAAHLSYAIAGSGRRVLVIDLDPQGQLALSYTTNGVIRRPDVSALCLSERPVADLIQQPFPEVPLNIIAGHPDTERVEREWQRGDDPYWHETIARRLKAEDWHWDYVIFDCHPSFSPVNLAALTYVEEIWLPVRLDAYSLDSFLRLKERLIKLRRSPEIVRNVIPTHFDLGGRRAEASQEPESVTVTLSGQRMQLLSRAKDKASQGALVALKDMFGDRLTPPVRNSSAFKAAVAAGQTIWTHAPSSEVAYDLAALTEYILHQDGEASAV